MGLPVVHLEGVGSGTEGEGFVGFGVGVDRCGPRQGRRIGAFLDRGVELEAAELGGDEVVRRGAEIQRDALTSAGPSGSGKVPRPVRALRRCSTSMRRPRSRRAAFSGSRSTTSGPLVDHSPRRVHALSCAGPDGKSRPRGHENPVVA